jgi:hypothetical protein
MDIQDIAFANNQVYMLRGFNLPLGECRSQIRKISYDSFYDHYRSYCDEKNVENMNLPYAIFPFYAFVFRYKAIPHPGEFVDEYFNLYDASFDVIDKNTLRFSNAIIDKRAVIARILRAYPSIIRDFHFYLMIVEAKCFDKVKYSCRNDINGIDLTVVHNKQQYEIALYLDTRRANGFKKIKDLFRHRRVQLISLPLRIDLADKCGDIYLYTKEDLEKVKGKIIK